MSRTIATYRIAQFIVVASIAALVSGFNQETKAMETITTDWRVAAKLNINCNGLVTIRQKHIDGQLTFILDTSECKK